MSGSLNQALQTPEERKLEYVQTQIEEMKAIYLRNEVDIYINKTAKWDEHEQQEVDLKVTQLERQNKTLTKAIEALEKLQTELE